MKRGTAQRRRSFRHGLLAEELCVWWLRGKGYRVLARRLRTPLGEIDILARRGRTLAVIEVKARPTRDACLEAVTHTQRARLLRAASALPLGKFAGLGASAHPNIRFDAMLVAPWRLPVHLKDAWRMEGGV